MTFGITHRGALDYSQVRLRDELLAAWADREADDLLGLAESNRWPLFRAAEDLLRRFRARNTEEEFQFGLARIAVPTYVEQSFREAIANAFVHRDYTRLGTVLAQWHEDAAWRPVYYIGGQGSV